VIRWLKIVRAELIRDLKISVRYPLDLATGIFILYVLFMGLFMGAKLLAGNQALAGNLGGVVVGYTMWFFAIMALNTMSMDIESEARQGTLEQVALYAPDFVGLMWVRAATHLTYGAGAVIILSLLIQATTGHYLMLSWRTLVPVVVVLVLTVAGLCGFGLILGGLSLVFKRIGQLSALVQFSMFFLAYTDLAQVQPPWREVVAHLPLARGVHILKSLLVDGSAPAEMTLAVAIGWLLLDSLAYALVGSLVFRMCERVARSQGLLAHY